MIAFDDFGPLPTIPPDATPAKQQAWRLVRELRALSRVSTVEAMVVITALRERDQPRAASPDPGPYFSGYASLDPERTAQPTSDASGGEPREHWILGFIRDVERQLTSPASDAPGRPQDRPADFFGGYQPASGADP